MHVIFILSIQNALLLLAQLVGGKLCFVGVTLLLEEFLLMTSVFLKS